MPIVYLAGPITGRSYQGCVDWRKAVAEQLWLSGIETLSPMRGKSDLEHEKDIADHYETLLSTGKAITTRDRFDVGRADMVLANLDSADRVSIGTVMEIAWADLARVPVVVVMAEGNPHWHAMIREVAGWIAPTLDEAIRIVQLVLLSEG